MMIKLKCPKVGIYFTQGTCPRSRLVGRSPWTAADAHVRLLEGRPGGRLRARAPAPHRFTGEVYLSEVNTHLRSISSCLLFTRIPRSIVRVILLN